MADKVKLEHDTVILNLNDDPATLEKVTGTVLKNLQKSSPYEDHRPIGEGGMGTVEMVHDTRFMRNIALKTLNQDSQNPESIIRFTEEAQITAQLEHPNIVPVYELNVNDAGQVYYTMKAVKGKNLKEIITSIKNKDEDSIKSFPLSRLLEIFVTVCNAMSYASSHGVVHRDLKPDNIMVGGYGEVYIVDWGLAKVVSETELTDEDIIDFGDADSFFKRLKKIDSMRNRKNIDVSVNDIIIGTPQYMAPERFTGDADETSEVYALGAILYNILTLELTVNAKELEEILHIVVNDEVVPPLELNVQSEHLPGGKIPPPLAAIAMKALAPHRDDRYRKIREIRKEIKAWQDGFVTQAEEANPGQILWRAVKRNKLESISFAAFILLIMVTFAVYIDKTQKEKERLIEAEKNSREHMKLLNREITTANVKSKEVKDKINQLTKLAPQFYTQCLTLIEREQFEKAEAMIDTALKLNRDVRYVETKANILLLIGRYDEAGTYFEEAFIDDNSEESDAILNLCRTLSVKEEISLSDLHALYNHAVSLKHHRFARVFQKRILNESQNFKKKILESFKGTQLEFVTSKMLRLTQRGFFRLYIPRKNISDITPLKGVPFDELYLNGNPISDISSLSGMPLKKLDISTTKVEDLTVLKGMPLTLLKANETKVENISPLNLMPLTHLELVKTPVKTLSSVSLINLNRLYMSDSNLESLEGIQKMRNLRYLNIERTEIDNLAPLNGLQLYDLRIDNTKVADINPLRNHPLQFFQANNTLVKNLIALKNCPLKRLSLSNSKIESLGGVKGTPIEELDISNNKITDISALAGIPLSSVNLKGTEIADLTPLSGSQLRVLRVPKSVTKITKLNKIISMAELDLRDSSLKKLPDLSGMDLDRLDLGNSEITDISGLKGAEINNLHAVNCQIKDLTPLTGKRFDGLYMNSTGITDLSFLEGCKIRVLDLNNNKIKDLSPLQGLPVKELSICSTEVTDLAPLSKMALSKLHIRDTAITSLFPIKGMPLVHLTITSSKITDLTPLRFCKNLRIADLSNTLINTLRPLSWLPLRELYLQECKDLKSLDGIQNMKRLEVLVLPKHITDFSFLKSMPKLKYIGRNIGEKNQRASDFWKKVAEETK